MNLNWSNFNHEYLRFITFPTICFCLVIFFKHVRRKFPIEVNCWFCNQNTKLPYNQRNCFTCPKCQQYNGFSESGDYNKIIPEQHDELLNQIVSPRKLKKCETSNGLCLICNNNQQLKIYQLATFTAMNEDMYDIEIDHFKMQIEKAYELCAPCKKTVKHTIANKNCALLGKQIEAIRKSGKTLLNKSTTAKQKILILRKYFLCSLVVAILYTIYTFKKDWIDIINGYNVEIAFAIAGSILTIVIIKLTSSRPPPTSLLNSAMKKIKKEKMHNPQNSPISPRKTNNISATDLSYDSFHSPLNSTGRSDDAGSICSELERITAKIPSCASSEAGADLSTSNNLLTSKSPSVFSTYSAFDKTQNLFGSKPQLFTSFQQLHLSAQATRPSSIASTRQRNERPILSPARLRNPWTDKQWDTELSSRSSSQSSGIYSRTASVYGDEYASNNLEHPFLNQTNSLSMLSLNRYGNLNGDY